MMWINVVAFTVPPISKYKINEIHQKEFPNFKRKVHAAIVSNRWQASFPN
jgi:hypothetical protein